MWIEYHEMSVSERINHAMHKRVVSVIRGVFSVVPLASTHYALANSYMDDGLLDRAVAEYEKTIAADKNFVQAYLSFADIYVQKEYLKKALEVLRRAEVVAPGNSEIEEMKKEVAVAYFREEGVKAFEKGSQEDAREFFKEALAADPDSPQIHFLLALSYDDQLNFDQVRDHLIAAIRLDPQFVAARNQLGNLYFGNGDFKMAIEQYEYALANHGNDPAVFSNVGLAYMNLEQYDKAIPYLEKAYASDPENVERLHNLAAIYRDRGMLDKATNGFREVIRMQPDYANVHNDLGDIYRKQGRQDEALKEYQKTIDQGQKRMQDFSDPSLLIELAYAYSEIGKNDKAKELVREALRVDPNYYLAYWVLARIYRNLRQPNGELDALRKAKASSEEKFLYIDDAIAEVQKEIALQSQR